MEKTYQYYSDGKLKHVDDALNANFDRLMTYDHQGRIYQGKTGSEANGSSGGTIPYRQTYTFNAFDNMTDRQNDFWGNEKDASYTFTNHRVSGWSYDADGRVTATTSPPDIPSTMQYDAAGRLIFKHDYPTSTEIGDKFTQYHDGDGRVLKRVTERCVILYPEPPENPPENCEFTADPVAPVYFIRSTVLGGEVVSDLKVTGDKQRSYVIAGGTKLAEGGRHQACGFWRSGPAQPQSSPQPFLTENARRFARRSRKRKSTAKAMMMRTRNRCI